MVSERAWWPTLAIVIGIFGGMTSCGYGLLLGAGAGLASAGCEGSGCAKRLSHDASSADALLALGGFGGGGLFVLGVAAKIVGHRRRAEASAATQVVDLPPARVVPPRPPPADDAS